jgi:hypothetical protein
MTYETHYTLLTTVSVRIVIVIARSRRTQRHIATADSRENVHNLDVNKAAEFISVYSMLSRVIVRLPPKLNVFLPSSRFSDRDPELLSESAPQVGIASENSVPLSGLQSHPPAGSNRGADRPGQLSAALVANHRVQLGDRETA